MFQRLLQLAKPKKFPSVSSTLFQEQQKVFNQCITKIEQIDEYYVKHDRIAKTEDGKPQLFVSPRVSPYHQIDVSNFYGLGNLGTFGVAEMYQPKTEVFWSVDRCNVLQKLWSTLLDKKLVSDEAFFKRLNEGDSALYYGPQSLRLIFRDTKYHRHMEPIYNVVEEWFNLDNNRDAGIRPLLDAVIHTREREPRDSSHVCSLLFNKRVDYVTYANRLVANAERDLPLPKKEGEIKEYDFATLLENIVVYPQSVQDLHTIVMKTPGAHYFLKHLNEVTFEMLESPLLEKVIDHPAITKYDGWPTGQLLWCLRQLSFAYKNGWAAYVEHVRTVHGDQ